MSKKKKPVEKAEENNLTEEVAAAEAPADTPQEAEEAAEDNEISADAAAEEAVSEEASESTDAPASEEEDTPAEEAPEAAAEEAPAAEAAQAVSKINTAKIFSLLCCIILFLAAAGITIYYITTASKAEFHADCTDTIMWANASVESGHLYDPDFRYACFLPFSVSLIMVPLIHMFGLSLTAHILGMMSFFLLLTVFMLLMMKEILGDIKPALIGTALFLAMTLSSAKIREIFWGHTIYYSLGVLCLVIGMFFFSHVVNLRAKQERAAQDEKNPKSLKIRLIVTFIVLCLFVFLTGMNGITGFSLFTLPFVGAIFAEQLLNTKTNVLGSRSAKVFCTLLLFGGLAVLGNFFNNKLLGDLTAGYQDANSTFSNMDTWLDHLHSFPMAWLRLLGVTNMEGTMFTKKEGIINLLCIITAGIIAVMPVIASCFYNKFGSSRRGRLMRIWIWIHWAVTAVVLLGYIFGVLAGAEWRIIPCIGTATIVTVLFAGWSITHIKNGSRLAMLLMIPVIMAGVSNLDTVRRMPKDGYKENNLFELADILKEEGLTKGYATFWNANSITVISGSEVWVSDVTLNETGVHRRLYQSSSNWYEDDPEQSEYFLLVTDYEYGIIESSSGNIIPEAIRVRKDTVNNTRYNILVFDHNFVIE